MQQPGPLELRLEELVEPLARARGLEVVGVDLVGSGRHRILRVSIDRPGARPGSGEGVTVEDCVRISREFSALLDVEDPIAGPFNLEVTSPGIERPLRKRRDFERFVGEEVSIRHRTGEGRRTVSGVLRGIDATDQVLFETAAGVERMSLDDIESAHLVFHFGKPRSR